MSKAFKITSFGITDIGKVHQINDDSILDAKDLQLYCVADGVSQGGYGYEASQMCLEKLKALVSNFKATLSKQSVQDSVIIDFFNKALMDISDDLHNHEIAHPEKYQEGFGTTIICLFIYNDTAYISQVGDSRCYLYNGSLFARLTEDHNSAHIRFRNGYIKNWEDVAIAPDRNRATQAIGFGSLEHDYRTQIEPSIYTKKLQPGDLFLLCSDGLNSKPKHHELKDKITPSNLKSSAEDLINLANDYGGHDNISVVLVKIENDVKEKELPIDGKAYLLRTSQNEISDVLDEHEFKSALSTGSFAPKDEFYNDDKEYWRQIKSEQEFVTLIKKKTAKKAKDLPEPQKPESPQVEVKEPTTDVNDMPTKPNFVVPKIEDNKKLKTIQASDEVVVEVKPKKTEKEKKSKRVDAKNPFIAKKHHWLYAIIAVSVVIIVTVIGYTYNVKSHKNLQEIKNKISNTGKSSIEIFTEYFDKAMYSEEAGMYQEAYSWYKKALELNPSHIYTRIKKARLELQILDKVKDAEQELSSLETEIGIGKDPDTLEKKTDILNLIGILQHKKNQINLALESFNRALTLSPKNPNVNYNLGLIYFNKGDYAKAETYFAGAGEYFYETTKDSIKIKKYFVEAVSSRGISNLKLGNYKIAADIFRTVIKNNPNWRQAYIYEIYSQYKIGDKSNYLKYADSFIYLDPFYFKKLQPNINIIKFDNDVSNEIKIIQEIADKSKDLYIVLSILNFIKEDNKAAVSNLKNAKKDLSDLFDAVFNFYSDKNEQASTLFDQILVKDYLSPLAHHYMGILKLKEGDENSAKSHFAKAINNYPEPNLALETKFYLGEVNNKLNNGKDALAEWTKVVAIDNRYLPAKEKIFKNK